MVEFGFGVGWGVLRGLVWVLWVGCALVFFESDLDG